MATNLIDRNLPFDNFGYITIEQAVKYNTGFLCPTCKSICRISKDIDFEYIDQLNIECESCNSSHMYAIHKNSYNKVRTPSYNVICEFDSVRLRIKNHERAGH